MKIIFCTTIFILITCKGFTQHKTLTLFYPDDSTNVISISNLDSMSIFICGASKVKYGGKDYNTVLIGNQCWLKENLDVGIMIPVGTDQSNNSILEKYCLNNSQDSCSKYGALYMWKEAIQYSITEGVKGICPEGWHIPTLAEFNALYSAVEGDGNSIKAVGQGYGSGAGTNTTGFSAMLGGIREYNRTFTEFNEHTHFWSSTGTATQANQIYLWSNNDWILFHYGDITVLGFSVRCIKDN
ncbi:MAG TPA: FISUMP domain-containing protein [Ignavibacteriaceae bacterium]|jgi:uncharacterized protein (TIGR02145 family)